MHLLSTIRPTQNQLRVLAKIVVAQDLPAKAAAEISDDISLVAARNLLAKLNLITFTDNNAKLTDKGQQVAKEQGITDETGQITDVGSKLAATNSDGRDDPSMPDSTAGTELPSTPPEPAGNMPDMGLGMGMEGYSQLFKSMLHS
jgi:hypothetical protein